MSYPFECKGCRKKVELVYFTKGMGFCEDCKDKVPTNQQFKEYTNPFDRVSHVGYKHRGRIKLKDRDDHAE